MKPWKFEVGMDVVCRPPPAGVWRPIGETKFKFILPVKDAIYRITDIEPGLTAFGGLWLTFSELSNDVAFECRYFEPVRKTDIGVLEALLTPAPKQRAKEDA